MAHARSASITFDEGPHLAVGYTTLRTGDLRLQPVHIHPPLANVLAALPVLGLEDLPDPRSVSGWREASLSAVADAVVWQYSRPRQLALASRFPIVLMTLLLGAVVYRWAADLFGRGAGLLALALFSCDPNLIAHGSLVTTDMAVTLWGTLSLFLTARRLRRSRWGYWAGAAVALGLALACKVSALSLLPALGLLWLLGPRALPWSRRLLAAAAALVLAGLVLWAAYGFEVRALPGIPLPLPAATHLEIYRSLQSHYHLGHPAFLLGQNSNHGWWFYFPLAFLLKTPLPTLLLLGLAAMVGLRDRMGGARTHPVPLWRWGPLVLFPLPYAVSSLFSSVNIGYRHLLPLLPFLFVFAGRVAAPPRGRQAAPSPRRALCLVICLGLLAWLLLGTVRLSPHYLAFFNQLAGGPAQGYRVLVDSNLDWGQNLWQLRDWMEHNQVEEVTYAHFSPARPQVYGIRADFLPPDPRAVDFAPFDPAPGVYAIGATVLQGVYTPDVNTYAWFRTHEPLARLGHALFVYRVPARPGPSWAAICADPLPVLSPQEVLRRFGGDGMRTILLDCGQARVKPAGGAPGAYLLPPGASPPPGATPELRARKAGGSPLYSVYRLDQPLAPPSGRRAQLDGPLDFLGYDLQSTSARPGEEIELWTFWQVTAVPARPLSIMGHLLGADGALVAVSDGLGVPVGQWRVGDVIAERHAFAVPVDVSPGPLTLRTGVYWLDSMERWEIPSAGGAGDSLSLGTIQALDQGTEERP